MELQSYCARYEKKIVALWNRCLSYDLISKETFERKISKDENFDSALALIALEGETVVGFLAAFRRRVAYFDRGLEPDKGWISALFVQPESRRKGVGTALLREAQSRLRAGGVKLIALGAYSPHYFFPGVDSGAYPAAAGFFERHGYLRGEACFAMRRYLFGYQIPKEVLDKEKKAREAGFCFAPFEERHSRTLLDFLTENFSAGWQYNARERIDRGKAEEQIWLCIGPDGDIAGYCQRGMDDNISRFGPFGVSERCRNHSLGSILFCRMLYDMACRGIYLVYFLSTDEPGARFYRRHGMEVFRTYWHYQKEL